MLIQSYFAKEKGMGLGDFVRGSLATAQLCAEYGLRFQIDLSHHQIGQYLVAKCDAPAPSLCSIRDLQDIPNFTVRALKKNLKAIVNLQSLQSRNLHIYTNVWPTFKIHRDISKKVRSFFEPNKNLTAMIDETLHGMQDYGVLHIRAGDLLSFGTQIGDVVHTSLDTLLDRIHPHVKYLSGQNYIVISDCAELKAALESRYGFYSSLTTPAHLALNSSGALDTLIDYFILSRAVHILQFSVHAWGSGFSDSIGWLYGVPVHRYSLISSPTN